MNKNSAKKYLVINDRSHKVVSEHETREAAIASLEDRGYEHHSGWTYRNPDARDYFHVAEAYQHINDNAVVMAAKPCGMTVDAYLQR